MEVEVPSREVPREVHLEAHDPISRNGPGSVWCRAYGARIICESISQPFRAGLTFGGRPSGPCVHDDFAASFSLTCRRQVGCSDDKVRRVGPKQPTQAKRGLEWATEACRRQDGCCDDKVRRVGPKQPTQAKRGLEWATEAFAGKESTIEARRADRQTSAQPGRAGKSIRR